MKRILILVASFLLTASYAYSSEDVVDFFAPLAARQGEVVRYDLALTTTRKPEVVIKRMSIDRICNGMIRTPEQGTVRMCSMMVDDGYEYVLRLWGDKKKLLDPIVCVPRLNSGKWQCAPGADAKVD